MHPKYREETAADDALRYIKPGSDDFVCEQQFARLTDTLQAWTRALSMTPPDTGIIERQIAKTFHGTPWPGVGFDNVRPVVSGLAIERVHFSLESEMDAASFGRSVHASLSGLTEILNVAMEVAGIETASDRLITRIRYELLGTGQGIHREQRTGDWQIEWRADDLKIVRWQVLGEIRSRAQQQFFAEITRAAFGANPSYSAQMLHGADYWRTVLDGSTGIDIYGHNGVSIGDFDGDGHDDVYVCQPAGLPNRLYRNRGNGTFEDVTEAAGVGVLDNTACALFADFTNNGRQDLVVVRANGPLLFVNQGNGKFKLKPQAFRFAAPPQGTFTGAAAADYDRDGRLDIYFCLYSFYQGTGQYKYPTPYFDAQNGPPNFLMRNNGDGTFEDVTNECGLDQNNNRYSFCCAWGDSNGDAWPDLYVVNDFGRKNLYRNNGNGKFTDVAAEAGVEDVGAGMGVCWFDYDNDGKQDLYVANMWTAAGSRITNDERFQPSASAEARQFYRKHSMGNSVLQNTGERFDDETNKSGAGIGRWAWSSDAWDFDHDGFADIYIANGMISGPIEEDLNSYFWRQVVAKSPNTAKSDTDYEKGWNGINELIRSDYSWSGFERNMLYANHGDGTFSGVSGAVGLDFLEDARTFALADFDGDGRQEILIKNRNAPQLRLMKNVATELAPAISFRLRGSKSNPDGIGSQITVETRGRKQTKMLQAGSGFLAQHSKEIFFGLGAAGEDISATIRWPGGTVQHLNGLKANTRVRVTEGAQDFHVEEFGTLAQVAETEATPAGEPIPEQSETWLLTPVTAPLFAKREKATLLTFDTHVGAASPLGLTISVSDAKNEELCAVYNLLFRYLFDRHADLPLPSSFLIDKQGQIVKIYRGTVAPERAAADAASIPRTDAEKLSKALPFPGISGTFEFGRNYLSLGSIFFQRGYFDSSGDFFAAAMKNDPSSAEALYGAGSVFLKKGQNNAAQECFEKAVTQKAAYPETMPNAWNNLGLLAARERDLPKAVGFFEAAIKIDPNHFVSLQNLGNAYRQQRRFDDSRTTLERALALKPRDAEVNYSLGMVFAQTNDTQRAFEFLQTALQIKPAYPEALNNLGVLYLRTLRRDDAVATFEKCIHTAPDFDQAYLNLARVYVIEKNPDKARSLLQSFLARHPDNEAVKQMLEQIP